MRATMLRHTRLPKGVNTFEDLNNLTGESSQSEYLATFRRHDMTFYLTQAGSANILIQELEPGLP